MNGHSVGPTGTRRVRFTDQLSRAQPCVCLDVCVRFGGVLVRAGRAPRRRAAARAPAAIRIAP
eukprot:7284187-Prymnesium_polylepis.1